MHCQIMATNDLLCAPPNHAHDQHGDIKLECSIRLCGCPPSFFVFERFLTDCFLANTLVSER